MLRTLFRVICILLLVTIIIDVTNSKCFDKSLTFKYTKQFGALNYGESIVSRFTQMKKKVKTGTSWTVSYKDVCLRVKPYLHTVYIWVILLIRNTCLFVQQIRSHLTKSSSGQKGKSLITPIFEE